MASAGRGVLVVAVLAVTCLPAVPTMAGSTSAVAIFPLAGEGLEAGFRRDVVLWISNAVNRVTGFSTTRTAAATRRLGPDQRAALQRCLEERCALELGRTITARYVILPRLGKQGVIYRLELTLVDVQAGAAVRQHVREKLAGEFGLRKAIKSATRHLLTARDPGLQGRLMFKVAQPGSRIYVDDLLVASSPVAEAVAVADGIRRIRVEKDGFLTWKKILPVPRGRPRTLVVDLEPKVAGAPVALVPVTPGAAEAPAPPGPTVDPAEPALVPLVPPPPEPAADGADPAEPALVPLVPPSVEPAPPPAEPAPVAAAAPPVEPPAPGEPTSPPAEPASPPVEPPPAAPAPVAAAPPPAGPAPETPEYQVPAAAPPPSPSPAEPASPAAVLTAEEPSGGVPSWVLPVSLSLLGVAVASAVGGSVLAEYGAAAESDGSHATVHNRTEAREFQDDADTYSLGANVMWGLTGAFAAAGIGLLLWDLLGVPAGATAAAPSRAPTWLCGAPLPGGGAVSLRGAF